MQIENEKWAIFWCDLLKPIIFKELESGENHAHLVTLASEPCLLPNGQWRKPSLSTLKRKLKAYQQGGFNALLKRARCDRGQPRAFSMEVLEKAAELKKEQPRRSAITINRLLNEQFGVTIPSTTLHRYLKEAGATRLKLGYSGKKVRKRWGREHTHELWLGDFAEGPYISDQGQVVPTQLAVIMDCHSRYGISARYYLRQNLDVLIDALLRGLAIYGAPLALYLDNAKVFHSHGLKKACYLMNTQLLHRPAGDPAPGGGIERLIQTIQGQLEAEVRAGSIMTLDELNHALAAWLAVVYHQQEHSELGCAPEEQYQKGLTVIRQVNLAEIVKAFHQRVPRRVNPTFADVQLNKRFYRVDPKWRGDRVEVRYDPFGHLDTVEIFDLKGVYLGIGQVHQRDIPPNQSPPEPSAKPKHNYIDLIVREHEKQLEREIHGIDYRKVVENRAWPFHEFVKTLADLLGLKGGLAAFTAAELESLKKSYQGNAQLNRALLTQAFERATHKSLPFIIHEINQLKKEN